MNRYLDLLSSIEDNKGQKHGGDGVPKVPKAPFGTPPQGHFKLEVPVSAPPAPPLDDPAPSPNNQATATYPCTACGRFSYHEPKVCYWCRKDQANQPHGPPCPGCGEACERCLP